MKVIPPEIASVLASMSPSMWSLTTCRPPMHYQSLEQLEKIQSNALLLPPPRNLLRHLETHNDHFGSVAVGLLYLSHGMVDECHDLITPYSWNDDTHFGGLAVPNSPALAVATYVHCLVHRWEGSNRGEFGMMGYQNANYWARATLSFSKQLPMVQMRQAIQHLFTSKQLLSVEARQAAQPWFQKWMDATTGSWDPRALNELCQTVEALSEKSPLAEVCATASFAEWEVLSDYCWKQAGYNNVQIGAGVVSQYGGD